MVYKKYIDAHSQLNLEFTANAPLAIHWSTECGASESCLGSSTITSAGTASIIIPYDEDTGVDLYLHFDNVSAGFGSSFEITDWSITPYTEPLCDPSIVEGYMTFDGAVATATGNSSSSSNHLDEDSMEGCDHPYSNKGNDHVWGVVLQAGTTYDITLHPTTSWDSALWINRGCEICLDTIDDTFGGDDEALVFTPTETGTYFIVVDYYSSSGGGGGGYELTVEAR